MAYTDIDKSDDYFNTKLYTGNGTAQSITGIGFKPDWVWIKDRDNGNSHRLFDGVRGVHKVLYSNSTTAEETNVNSLTSFTADGFDSGSDSGMNGSGSGFVSWNWLAGTSASGNTTGSGTAQSYTASVSTTAGFSITAFTGNGTANHTIPHNLGVAPDWFIIKKRIGTGDPTVRDWNVYHKSLGNTKRIALNSNGVVSTSSEYWNNTSPTSSVINLGTNDQINGNNNTYICYAFAEKKGFSKFGSYVGNGNADGTFIYTGFKPAFVMVKNTGAAENWIIFDNRRPGYNLTDALLKPNLSNAESTTGVKFDMVSNGFKARVSDAEGNSNGDNFIYMAFAENPFVTSGGIPTTAR